MTETEEPRDLLGLSNQMFEAGKFGECLVILQAAKAGGLPSQQLDTQKMIVHMHLYAERKDWWKASARLGKAERHLRWRRTGFWVLRV